MKLTYTEVKVVPDFVGFCSMCGLRSPQIYLFSISLNDKFLTSIIICNGCLEKYKKNEKLLV